MSLRKLIECFMCDRSVATVNADGWCEHCVAEFEQVKQRKRWECTNAPCATPVSCAMEKRCCLLPKEDAAPHPQQSLF